MNRTRWFGVLAILVVAAALRFYRVGEMSLRADEAANLFLAAEAPSAIIQPFITTDPHLPIYFLLLHYWMVAAGRSELAVRFPTIFAGVLVVALVYALGRRAFPTRPTIALIGAFCAAINPYLIWDAQDAYMYTFLTAIAAGSFIAFLRAVRPNASLRDWIGYVSVNALGLFLHYLAGLILIAQGALWLVWTVRGNLTRRASIGWIVAQAATAALFAPWLFFALPLLTNFQTDFFPRADGIEMLQRALTAFSVGRVDSRLMPAMVDPSVGSWLASGFALIFSLGWLRPAKRSRANPVDGRIVLGMYLFIPLLAIFLFSLWRFPIFDERYVLFLIPAFVLVLARGIDNLRAWTGKGWLPAGALGLVLLSSMYSLTNYYFVPAFAKSPDWRGWVRFLHSNEQPGDVVIQNYPDPALPYYLQNRIPRVLLPHSSTEPAAAVNADLDRLTRRYRRLWFQPVPYGAWDSGGLVATWLNRHALETDARQFHGVRLELYLPIAIALQQARSIDATLGGQIRLVAFDRPRAGGKDTALPGTDVRVVLYWRALEHIERDYTVFVHLYRSDGRLESQQDHQPVRGTFPTSEWNTDEIVVDTYDVSIPSDAPRGTFLLAAGMYDPQTLQRLSATDRRGAPLEENRVPLTEVTVTGGASR
jgi:4-amino-4-deoxy-L-arabinose transferase-like glycosyltransferase